MVLLLIVRNQLLIILIEAIKSLLIVLDAFGRHYTVTGHSLLHLLFDLEISIPLHSLGHAIWLLGLLVLESVRLSLRIQVQMGS